MLEAMTTTLITGGNKGLGREAARRLLEHGHTVYIGARDPERGRAAADALGAHFLHLDVTDEDLVHAAADVLGRDGQALDVLVNNAGIGGRSRSAPTTRAGDLREVYETNVFGVVGVLHAFLPLLERSRSPVAVNVSSGMGSLAVTTDPTRLESTLAGLAYPSSKSALNMLTSQYAKACPWLRINAVDPGTPPPTSTATAGRRPSSRARRSSCAPPSPPRRAHRGLSRRERHRALVVQAMRACRPARTSGHSSRRTLKTTESRKVPSSRLTSRRTTPSRCAPSLLIAACDLVLSRSVWIFTRP
jgi:NAD(P)-dependent dehydrogenase (short-subunit alcohol dehydrogenase family)